MGALQLLLSWVNRAVILVSLLLFVVAGMAKEGSIPLSRASLRVAHLISLRYDTLLLKHQSASPL